MTPAKRKRLLNEADRLAVEQATTWHVYYKTGSGRTRDRIVNASNQQTALRRVRGAYLARPILPTKQWQAVYTEVGL